MLNIFKHTCKDYSFVRIIIILLYVLFNTFEKFFPNFTLSKVAIELKTNINSRKSTLLLAFTYDMVIMLYCILFFSIKEYRFEWAYIPVYEIITLGGVCMFYITTVYILFCTQFCNFDNMFLDVLLFIKL